MNANSIKARFIDFLLNSENQPKIICSEIFFHDGLRRADLATLDDKGLHAYEIKSSSDDLRKLSSQLTDYLDCFNSISIITDKKHLSEVRDLTCRRVGIFTIENGVVTQTRQPGYVTRPNKASRLHMLTKVELTSRFSKLFKKSQRNGLDKNHDKTSIIDAMCNILHHKTIMKETENLIFEKNKRRYEIFLAERGSITLEEDILLLHQSKNDIR